MNKKDVQTYAITATANPAVKSAVGRISGIAAPSALCEPIIVSAFGR